MCAVAKGLWFVSGRAGILSPRVGSTLSTGPTRPPPTCRVQRRGLRSTASPSGTQVREGQRQPGTCPSQLWALPLFFDLCLPKLQIPPPTYI